MALSLGLFCGVRSVSSQSHPFPQDNANRPPWKVRKLRPKVPDKVIPETGRRQERVIENQIPSHLPITVEILNYEKEPLLRNLEIKVTNTATKPIYFLELNLTLPDVLSPNGNPLVFPLLYGRHALIESATPLESSDVPLNPGESIILKPLESNIKGFEILASQGQLSRPDFDRVFLWFYYMVFEDRTGFYTIMGVPIPGARKVSCVDKGGGGAEANAKIDSLDAHTFRTSGNILKALISPILFFTSHSFKSKSTPSPDTCCSGSTGCYFGKAYEYSCNCGIGNSVQTTACSDPEGACITDYRQDKTCPDPYIPGLQYSTADVELN
jgi:hypothetical protein